MSEGEMEGAAIGMLLEGVEFRGRDGFERYEVKMSYVCDLDCEDRAECERSCVQESQLPRLGNADDDGRDCTTRHVDHDDLTARNCGDIPPVRRRVHAISDCGQCRRTYGSRATYDTHVEVAMNSAQLSAPVRTYTSAPVQV